MIKNIIIGLLLAYGILATHWVTNAHYEILIYHRQWRHLRYTECVDDAPKAIQKPRFNDSFFELEQ